MEKEKKFEIPDRWPYLLRRLREHAEVWRELTFGALTRLAKKYGVDVVTTALGYVRESPPLGVRRAYPYFEGVCIRVQAEREAAS